MAKKTDESIEADRVLDCLGLFCPEPIYRTRMELDKLKKGQILEVIADDPAAEEDLKRFCKRTGQQLLKLEKDKDGAFHFLIKKLK